MAQTKARIWQVFQDLDVASNQKGERVQTCISAKTSNDCVKFTSQMLYYYQYDPIEQ